MRSRQCLKYLILLPLILFVTCGAAKAQSIVTGAINGTVTDASGAVVAEASVTVVNEATQETQTAVSGAKGGVQISLLKTRRYNVTAGKKGFRKNGKGSGRGKG